MSSRRVVITGMGLISPLGNCLESLWSALAEGRSGVRPLDEPPLAALPIRFAGVASDFQEKIDDFGELAKDQKKAIRKGLKVMCRECKMGIASAQRAISDAGLEVGSFDPERAGVSFGSDYMLTRPDEFVEGVKACRDEQGQFDFSRWGKEGLPKVTPLWLLKYLPNMPASHIAIFNDLRGPNNSITLREAAANLAVGEAFRIIARGSADVMVAGATGTRLHPMKTLHAVLQEEIADNDLPPQSASRPFDLNRTGVVLGEGAATVVLEDMASAEARGARIYAEIVGHASSTVADRDFAAQRDVAIANCLVGALRDASATINDVGHLHAHGLSTRSSDEQEARGIGRVFSDLKVPVTAAKSYFGNLGAGSGLIELIASVLALRNKRLFGVLNYSDPDPKCPISVARGVEANSGSSFLNVNVTPQGQASAIMVRSLE